MPFEDYLKMPGLSYSGVKNGGAPIDPTEKMRFGSLVDAYLFEPHKYNGDMYDMVRPVALEAHRVLGAALRHGKRQVVVTCKMRCMGLVITYKGRVDLWLQPIVIDFKVSDLPILDAINHFGYHHQLNGYAIPLQAQKSILISVGRKPPHKVQMMPIENSGIFWRQQIIKHGTPC